MAKSLRNGASMPLQNTRFFRRAPLRKLPHPMHADGRPAPAKFFAQFKPALRCGRHIGGRDEALGSANFPQGRGLMSGDLARFVRPYEIFGIGGRRGDVVAFDLGGGRELLLDAADAAPAA